MRFSLLLGSSNQFHSTDSLSPRASPGMPECERRKLTKPLNVKLHTIEILTSYSGTRRRPLLSVLP